MFQQKVADLEADNEESKRSIEFLLAENEALRSQIGILNLKLLSWIVIHFIFLKVQHDIEKKAWEESNVEVEEKIKQLLEQVHMLQQSMTLMK